MSCEILAIVNGKSYVIGTSDTEITDLASLEKLLRDKNPKELKEILKQIPQIDSIETIDLNDIKENSLGVFTPRDILSGISSKEIRDILTGLNIPQSELTKQSVVVGLGDNNVKTQYYNGHIFLNMNYMYDNYNKAIALVELATFLKDPINYQENSKYLSSDNKEVRRKLLEILVPNNEKTIKGIEFIYDEVNRRRSLDIVGETTDSFNSRHTVLEVGNEYYDISRVETRDINYTPKQFIPVKNIEQGDLILIPYGDNKTVYELFYDYKINIDGNIELKTIVKSGDNFITRSYIIEKGKDLIWTRKFNNTVYQVPSAKNTQKLNVDKNFKYWNYQSIMDLLKTQGGKIPQRNISREIKEIKGNTIVLDNDKTVSLEELKSIEINLPDISNLGELSESNMSEWQKDPGLVLNGDTIAINKNGKLISVIALALGNVNKVPVIYYVDQNSEISFVNESNIKYVAKPLSKYTPSTIELNSVKNTINSIFGDNTENTLKVFLSPKKATERSFKDSEFSIQEMDESVFINNGDFIYDKLTKRIFKVIKVNSSGLIKTTIFDTEWKYITLKISDLNRHLILSKTPVNSTFAKASILKNRYNLGIIPDLTGTIAEEVKVVEDKTTGYIRAIPYKSQIDSNDIDVTSTYKEYLNTRFKWNKSNDELKKSPLFRYMYKDNKTYVKDSYNTLHIPLSGNWSNVFDKIIPGSFIVIKGNSKPFVVEKILGNKILVSMYHFSTVENGDSSFKNIRAEKFFIDASADVQQLFLPKWATENYNKIKEILISKNTNVVHSYVSNYSKSDSPEIINELIKLLQDKFKVEINTITNKELKNFKNLGVENSAAFVYEGGLYVNLDKASIEEPLHEILHLVLATMKSNNPDIYYNLINSVQYHPQFQETAKLYSDEINSDILEETFVKLLSKTFRSNILKDGVFSSETFNKALKNSISSLFLLEKTLVWEDPFSLLGRPVADIMTSFVSKLVENEEGLINFTDAFKMFEVSGKIKQMLKDNQLIQECNG